MHRGPQCSRARGPARSRPCPSAGRPRPRAQCDCCRRRPPPHPGDRPAARSACSPLVAEPTGGTSHFPPMAGEAVSFVSGAQAPRAEAAPQPARPNASSAHCPRTSRQRRFRPPAASQWLCEVLEAGHADVPRSIAGGSEMRDRRASGSASSLSHGAAGAGRAAPECVQTALAPRSLLTLPVCGRELSRRPNFLCFLMLFFNCFKAAVTVKPGPEPLAPRRRLVQEQARRPAEARHQRHALLALPAHRGKDAVPSARFLGVGLLLSVCVFLTVHMGRAWDRREGYPKGEDIAARNFE